MMLSRFWMQALVVASFCVSAFAGSDGAGDTTWEAVKPHGNRMDRAWKLYKNAELGYCVSYPSRWGRHDAFNGSGIFVAAKLSRSSRAMGEIDVGPIDVEGPEDARLEPASLTLDQDLEEHLEGLKKFVRAERVEVIAQHQMELQGSKALYAKNQYYDPLERSRWMEEVVFIRRKGQLYRLELQCSPNQIDRLEPVFAYLVNSFQFDCK